MMIAYYDRLKPASPDFHLFLSVKQYLLGKSLHKDNSKVNSHFKNSLSVSNGTAETKDSVS